MKKKLILLVVLVIILIVVIISSILIINKLESNKNVNIQDDEKTLEPPDVENEVIEEFVDVQENGIKKNTSSKFKETKTVDGLEISNSSFLMSNGQTIFKAKVTNKSESDFNEKIVNIVLLDKEGKEISRFPAIINNVKAGKETNIETSITLDYSNAYDYKIEY